MKILRQFVTAALMAIGMTAFAQAADDYPANYAKAPRFRALLCYDPTAEEAHVQFDKQAIHFFHKLTFGEGYILDVTTSLNDYCDSLQNYNIIIMCNYCVLDESSRKAFRSYISILRPSPIQTVSGIGPG